MKNKITLLIALVFIISLFTTPVYAQTNDDFPEYIVQSGDTLSQIANLFDVSMDEILQINNIQDANSIYPDLRLKIPGYPGIKGLINPVVLNLGESWQNLLVKYNSDENTLIKINKLISPHTLYPGKTLLMPINESVPALNPVALVNEKASFLEKAAAINAKPYVLLAENRRNSSLDFYSNDLIYTNNLDLPSVNSISESIESLSVTPLPLSQGDTISVKVKTKTPLTLTGKLNGIDLHFFSLDNVNYFALQGIHAMATPGITDFSINATDGSNPVFSFTQNILLVSGNFDTDPNLTVAPEMIDPAITGPELEKVTALTSVFTPEKYWEGVFLSPDTDYALEIPNYEAKKEITSFFGTRRTYNDDPTKTFHTGVDFGGGVGLPIVATAAGKVVFAGVLDVRGNATIIDHGLGVFSAYYHQSEILVKTGDRVEKGQQIGKVGNTGRVDRANEYAGAGAHLHWEIWVNGIQVNPLEWLNSEYP
jgi:murein DD-endopeptidase MepM/ murein hydrolase activator NlpD